MPVMKWLFSIFLFLIPSTLHAIERSWQDDVIYFMMTDRFYDGDPSNNTPHSAAEGLVDPQQKNINLYHGGDFRGIEIALQSGYFTQLGITAIWITPPVRNVWNTSYDEGDRGKTGYHGYWAQDFLDIDPHLTSAKALDGTAYPDSREGRMMHYRDLVRLAHSKNIRIVQDIVCNHVGPVFYYDSNKNGKFDRFQKSEWIAPFMKDGYHDNATWAKVTAWNIHRAAPVAPVSIFGKSIPCNGILSKLEAYGRKGFNHDSLGKNDGEEVDCDFFSLRDIWTHPDGEHYDEIVDEFVRIYAFYMTEIGVDGLRIDTVKHVHHQFWTDFVQRLRKTLGEKSKHALIFGEIYDGAPEKLGKYTYGTDGKSPCLDGTLNFQMCWAMRNYLRHGGNHHGHANGIERAMRDLHGGPERGGRVYFNPNPGPGGLNARQQSITFIENHDGINRFRVGPVTARRNLLANAMVLTMEGIPCLYYGTEDALHDLRGKIGHDSETGRLTFIKTGDGGRVVRMQKSDSFIGTRTMLRARGALPALRKGLTAPLWVDGRESSHDDGTFLFARYLPDQSGSTVLVGFNLSDQPRTLHPALIDPQQKPLFAEGTVLERIVLPGIDAAGTKVSYVTVGGKQTASLILPADSVSLWRVKSQAAP